MRTILARLGIDKVDGILLDLGVSSHQLNSAARGFSFTSEAPLDMRMDKERGPSAYDLIHTLSNAELERIIREYGEEKTARRIALAITRRRVISSIKTTTELARIVAGAFPVSRPKNKIHPATRTFQAIRIAVNNELKNLQQALEEGVDLLASGGRLCVISFHSLEDRIVKNSFSQYARGCICPPDLPVCACGRKPILKIVTRKPVIPEETEIKENPRARSAKLRAAERI
jgi:16S rRNA (cytosine1402-N4)-methyltransferase